MKKYHNIPSFALPFLVIITFAFLAIDTVKAPGSVAKHLFIDSQFLGALALVLLLISPSPGSRILALLLKINSIVLIFLALAYFVFAGVEAAHFPNYVLSAYKIHLDGLIYLPLFSLLIYLTEKIKEELSGIFIYRLKDWVLLIILVLTTYFTVSNFGAVLNTAFKGNLYIVFHSADSYDSKMYYQWGDFYRFMKFVKNNTPENARVLIPPELEPWLGRTGDNQLVRAFLFPRVLVQYKNKDIPDLKSLGKGTFILVSWGDRDCWDQDCHGWPKQEIRASRILYKDPNSDKVIETIDNFVFEKDDYKYVYGLIEI